MSAGRHYLEDARRQLRKYRALAEAAIAQVSDSAFFTLIDPEANSIALVMKHMAGNMRSRWRDFLTTDGEKPDRDRDSEFETAGTDNRERILAQWGEGWDLTLEAIDALKENDLERVVTIRGEPHTVLEAINRQLTHYAYHVGQIVFLSRHFAGPDWKSLSIPKGRSREFEVSKNGRSYRT